MNLASGVRDDLLAAVRLASTFAPLGTSEELEQLLYTSWFTHAGSAVDRPDASSADADPFAPTLMARLRAAHGATARFEHGWTARGVSAGGVVVAERGGESVEFAPPDYVNMDHPCVPARSGDRLAVTTRRDGADESGGWWVAYATVGPAPESDMVRLYWNCPVESAPLLVAGISGVVESLGVPYTLKCPAASELFDRVDPVVLYLGLDRWADATEPLRRLHESLADYLRLAVPPLTLPMGRGAAVAEDPSDGQSFGQSRARAVAAGLVRASALGLSGEAETIAVILEQLTANGISPIRPYQRVDSPPDRLTRW